MTIAGLVCIVVALIAIFSLYTDIQNEIAKKQITFNFKLDEYVKAISQITSVFNIPKVSTEITINYKPTRIITNDQLSSKVASLVINQDAAVVIIAINIHILKSL